MKRTLRHATDLRKVAYATASAGALLAILLMAIAIIPASATAATVSGAVKNGKDYRLLLVQADGTTKNVTITQTNGAFSIRGVRLSKASLQLVKADGSYYGPIVLKASATKAFIFIKGSPNLKLGTVLLKGGYALVGKARVRRYQTLAEYTAKAARGKPVGADKLGRVPTSKPLGLNGPGVDLDRDGIINAFDIDDNGNRIIDNIDRTGRGAERPRAGISGTAAAALRSTPARRGDGGPPPLPTDGAFRIFSNFWLTDETSINVNIPGIADIDGLIAQNLPTALTLATDFIEGDHAQLDGLGNSYIREHILDDVTYPLVNDAPPTYADGLLNLIADPRHPGGSGIMPGALPSEIGSGNCFVETTPNGTKYPGTVNFVFNTAPALKSYQFNTDGGPTEVVYDANGVRPEGNMLFMVPTGASSVTLTFWRPQRKAAPGEPGSAGGWVDIGGLWYSVTLPDPPRTFDDPGTGTHEDAGAYSNATANGVPVPPTAYNDGVLDPIVDLPSDPANTISFTLDLAKCFSSWPTLVPGAGFQMGLEARGGYGDNAAIGLWFELL